MSCCIFNRMDGTIIDPTVRTRSDTPAISWSIEKTFPASIAFRIGEPNSPISIQQGLEISTEKSPDIGFAVWAPTTSRT